MSDGPLFDYYNTTNLTGEELADERSNAKHQEAVILEIYRGGRDFTPWEIEEQLDQSWPITSIRRAITNLEKAGKLTKTNIRRRGRYGKLNYAWRLNDGR